MLKRVDNRLEAFESCRAQVKLISETGPDLIEAQATRREPIQDLSKQRIAVEEGVVAKILCNFEAFWAGGPAMCRAHGGSRELRVELQGPIEA